MATDETYSSLESPAFYSPSSSTLSRPPMSNTAGKSDTSMTLKRPYYIAAMDEIGSPDEELMNNSSGMMEDQEGNNMGECIQLQLAAGQAGGELHQKRARRLTVEQVRALERAFDVENKLEPDRKAQLASQLGLQERQVAVWFQNRRARCKTKQMEKDFQALKKKMELLKADRDKLISEKEQLEAEVQRLKREMKEKERPEVKQEEIQEGISAAMAMKNAKAQSPASPSMPPDQLVQQYQQQQSPAETKRSSPSSAASEINNNNNNNRSSNHSMAYNNSVRECEDASMNNGSIINNLPQESNSADGSALDHVDSSSSTLDQLLISRISPPLNQINHAINHPNHNLQDHPYGNNLHHNLDHNYGFLDVYDAYGCISAVHLKGLDFLPKEEGFVPMADWWEAS